jgi:hypothetical protein
MASLTKRPWHSHSSNNYGPFLFFDAAQGSETNSRYGSSMLNYEEANLVVELFQALCQHHPTIPVGLKPFLFF